jgi:hypothetical protein
MSTNWTPPLGWIPFDDRTAEQMAIHEALVAQMPAYNRPPQAKPPNGTRVMLTDTWKNKMVVDALGMPFTGVRQVSGSCVWAGGLTAATTLNFVEVLAKGDLDEIMIPHMLPNYGLSRKYGGISGTGSGSFGSTFAVSGQKDGSGDARAPGRPTFTTNNMFCWGEATELKYSNARNITEEELAEGKKHLYRTVTRLHSAEQVRDAIMNGDPVTRAFSYYCDPGSERIVDGRCVGKYDGYGGHQESWLGYECDKNGNEWVWEQNQWGMNAYREDPAGGPRGGCWMPMSEVDRFCKQQGSEIYSFSAWDGTQVKKITWLI